MAKQGSDPKDATLSRIRRTEAYAEKVRLLFAKTVNDILALNKTMPSLDEGVMFSFDGESVKKQKEVEILLRRLHSAVTMAIQQGVKLEWDTANQECDKLVQSVFGKKVLESPEFSAWMGRNTAARDAFLSRSEHGLNLSDRVWKSVRQLRDEMEVAMTVSIGEGESSSSMSRKVRQYLNNPDDMFRRFRYKKGEKDIIDPETGEITGKEIVWGKKWKKRIKDEVTGKYKWIYYDRDSYKTGAGVYKSSARNAMRVARTETNIAYRRADNARWQDMDFVLGQRVQLSKNHPKKDICDKLQGDYPKDFVFDGWHPQCFCFATPILMDESEMAKVTEAFLKGEKYTPRGKQITDYPAAFKDWVRDHAEDIAASRERGTEPYFIRNNAQAIDEILNPKQITKTIKAARLRQSQRTPEQIEDIKRRWAKHEHRQAVLNAAKVRQANRTPEQIAAIKDAARKRQERLAKESVKQLTPQQRKAIYDSNKDRLNNLYDAISKGQLSKSIELTLKKMDDDLQLDLFDEVQRRLSILENAAKRHASRTNDDIRAIQDMADEHTYGKDYVDNVHELENKLGMKRIKRMNHDDADNGKVNPNFSWERSKRKYRINCSTCSGAYILRRMGFNIEAKANTKRNALNYTLSQGNMAWSKWKDGINSFISTKDWMLKNNIYMMDKDKYYKFLDENTKEAGIYEWNVGWQSGGGHSTLLERTKDGELLLIDQQNAVDKVKAKDTFDRWLDYAQKMHIDSCRGIMRVDNAKFNPIYANAVKKAK